MKVLFNVTMALLSWSAFLGAAYLLMVCSLSIATETLSAGELVANAIVGTVALVAAVVTSVGSAVYAAALTIPE